jgi:hypothetical protein
MEQNKQAGLGFTCGLHPSIHPMMQRQEYLLFYLYILMVERAAAGFAGYITLL